MLSIQLDVIVSLINTKNSQYDALPSLQIGLNINNKRIRSKTKRVGSMENAEM